MTPLDRAKRLLRSSLYGKTGWRWRVADRRGPDTFIPTNNINGRDDRRHGERRGRRKS